MPEPLSMLDAGAPILPVSPYVSNYIRPTLNHGLQIWWALFWPTTLISAILSAAAEFGLLRVIYEHRNIPGNLIDPIVRFVPYVISYAVAFFIMEYILHKNFRRFRIGLVSCGAKFTSQVMPATFARTARVWWTYSWRTVIWRLVIFFVASIPIGALLGVFTRTPAAQTVIRVLVIITIDAAAGLFVMYANILDEDFGDFRVCVLPLRNDPAASALPVATPIAT
jgi:hypothetical protein